MNRKRHLELLCLCKWQVDVCSRVSNYTLGNGIELDFFSLTKAKLCEQKALQNIGFKENKNGKEMETTYHTCTCRTKVRK